ncbi:hypothetical protein AB6F55_18170 [Providencia hangzhouensis]
MSKDSIAKMLGIKIRNQRESHKMTVKQTANLIGVTEDLKCDVSKTVKVVLM